MNNKIVFLGEIMIRFSPKEGKRFNQSSSFDINFGGAEANTAMFLSRLGERSSFITKVPNNPIGEMAIDFLNANRVNTEDVIVGEGRMGAYYLEKGYGVRNSKVVYDRKDSAMEKAMAEEFNIEEALKEAKVFHVSGITAALGEEKVKLIKRAIKYCKENKIFVSVDLNYRSKLWSFSEFTKTMGEVIKDVDLVFGWIDKDVSEFKVKKFNNEGEEKEFFTETFKKLNKDFGVKAMATTLRDSISSNRNKLKGVYADKKGVLISKEYEFDILDRVGAGDAFSGGLLYSLVNERDERESLEFAVCAGVYKHTVVGDVLIGSEEEIKEVLMENKGLGVVR
ncbi:MAG: PfkB family carbohydrate kinase [Sarcina sp.]